MRQFEYFLQTQEVKQSAKDEALARSLIKDMKERIKDASLLDISKFAKIVFENVYDALRDFADALLAIDGFKSYSHQASFAYLAKYGFNTSALDTLDRFRYKRNGSKYYGQRVSIEEAREIAEFFKNNKEKISTILEGKKQ